MFHGKKERYVFLDKDYMIGEVDENSSFILSPSFYWIKKEEIPVKSLREAQKVAKSLFDYLPDSHELKFVVNKKEDRFLFIAYNPKEILAALKAKGIKKPNNIYLAQEAFFEKNVLLNEQEALITVDDIVIKVPVSLIQKGLEDFQKIDLSKLDLKEPIKINYFNVIDKEYVKIALPLAIISFLFLGEVVMLYKENRSILDKRFQIAKRNNLPLFSMQLDSIKAMLEKKERKQIAIRKRINRLLQILQEAHARVVSLDIQKNKLQFTIESTDTRTIARIKDLLQRSGLRVQTQRKDKVVRFQCA